jgi:chemotaxis signal transduction protein
VTQVAQESSTGASAGGGLRGPRPFELGVCVFFIGGERYGLDVALVGEVVAVEHVIAVPGAPAGVLGLFNLRGTPVALLELSRVLDLGHATPAALPAEPTALVLVGPGGIVAAARVDRVGAVVQADRATPMPHERAADHAAVEMLLETETHGVVTVLDGAALLAALERIKFR